MEDDSALRLHLSPGERLLWMSQPIRGLRFTASDVLLVPFSLIWGGFALFWEAGVVRMHAPVFFRLWGMPFVLVGVYLIVGRFFHDAWRRSRTLYALTDQRAIIVSGGFQPRLRSLPLRSLPEISISEERGGRGTITFGSPSGPFGVLGRSSWPGTRQNAAPAFEGIENARSVHELIRNAQLLAAA
jgi:hypothetical protein